MNVRSVSQSEINITLGDNSNDVCNVRTSSDTVSYNIATIINTQLLIIGDHLQTTS